jgi:hypothetical protein
LNSLNDLGKSLAAHALAFQDPVECMMARAGITFQSSNSEPNNVALDIFARNHLFRLLVLERLEFNKT